MQTKDTNLIFTPELLAPAGSRESLEAAIEAGADAVYMGGEFNARAGARNFDRSAIREAVSLCSAYGVKSYITLNTLVYKREMREWLEYASYLWECGADAFILADLGAAALLKEHIPDVRMHASTQMSVHNSAGVRLLASLGYERVVVARELPREELKYICENTGTEIEAFVHGALCVSASGQCLFSSLVGGRSGNRGECAQPCRLDYDGRSILSLRDNCLAKHITELCDMRVASLKIEGRMKTPEYVYGTVSTYRRLLDERRNAAEREIARMAETFSRSGFTDGYYIGKKDGMCGVRTDRDKQKSAAVTPFAGLTRRIGADIDCVIEKNTPARLCMTAGDRSVCVEGVIPSAAQNAPIDESTVRRALTKLGSTPFEARKVNLTLGEGLFMRASDLNALRRAATDALTPSPEREKLPPAEALFTNDPQDAEPYGASARFASARQLSESGVTVADIDRIYLPLSEYSDGCGANGVILPAVAFDGEWEALLRELRAVRGRGVRCAIAANIAQIPVLHEMGFTVTADFRLNCTNPHTAARLRELGADEIILSPELKIGGMRDIRERKSVIVYGRIPLMLCEKCPGREMGKCPDCREGKPYYITDRTGMRFPVLREAGHRAVIYNCAPVYTADTRSELARAGRFSAHFIFSDENRAEIRRILGAYRRGAPAREALGADVRFRRIH